MTVLWIGLALFFGVHLLPTTPLKPALVSALGAGRYKAVLAHGWLFNRVLVPIQAV